MFTKHVSTTDLFIYRDVANPRLNHDTWKVPKGSMKLIHLSSWPTDILAQSKRKVKIVYENSHHNRETVLQAQSQAEKGKY
jgi:hypothetical protein